MFNNVCDCFCDYVSELPHNAVEVALTSGVYSFGLGALMTMDINKGISKGALAAVVSLVSSLTLPFFRRIFADHEGNISWAEHAISMIVNLGFTQCLFNSLTKYRVNLLSQAYFSIVVDMVLNGMRKHSTHEAQLYIFV